MQTHLPCKARFAFKTFDDVLEYTRYVEPVQHTTFSEYIMAVYSLSTEVLCRKGPVRMPPRRIQQLAGLIGHFNRIFVQERVELTRREDAAKAVGYNRFVLVWILLARLNTIYRLCVPLDVAKLDKLHAQALAQDGLALDMTPFATIMAGSMQTLHYYLKLLQFRGPLVTTYSSTMWLVRALTLRVGHFITGKVVTTNLYNVRAWVEEIGDVQCHRDFLIYTVWTLWWANATLNAKLVLSKPTIFSHRVTRCTFAEWEQDPTEYASLVTNLRTYSTTHDNSRQIKTLRGVLDQLELSPASIDISTHTVDHLGANVASRGTCLSHERSPEAGSYRDLNKFYEEHTLASDWVTALLDEVARGGNGSLTGGQCSEFRQQNETVFHMFTTKMSSTYQYPWKKFHYFRPRLTHMNVRQNMSSLMTNNLPFIVEGVGNYLCIRPVSIFNRSLVTGQVIECTTALQALTCWASAVISDVNGILNGETNCLALLKSLLGHVSSAPAITPYPIEDVVHI